MAVYRPTRLGEWRVPARPPRRTARSSALHMPPAVSSSSRAGAVSPFLHAHCRRGFEHSMHM